MCISAGPTKFSGTITGVYEAAENVHVAFYANTVARDTQVVRRRGDATGNALLLPVFGEWESIAAIDFTDAPHVLKDIASTLQPRSRGIDFSIGATRGGAADVIIEQVGIYTVVRARNASLICDAVETIEARKRPSLNRVLFDKLAEWYKDVPFAVCCFSDEDEAESTPIAFSYKPLNPNEFRIYMLDSHDGGVPRLDEQVDVDHTIFAGSYRMEEFAGIEVYYRDELSLPLKFALPKQVVGEHFGEGTTMVNGDVVVLIEDVIKGEFKGTRVVPPNAPAREPVALPSTGW